jgi:hypothetical protein
MACFDKAAYLGAVGMLVGFSSLVLGGCSASQSGAEGGDPTSAWTISEGTETDATGPGASGGLDDKSACTYIQWCDAPASFSAYGVDWGTVCRVRTSCNKYAPSIPGLCDGDLRALGCSRHQPAVIAYTNERL